MNFFLGSYVLISLPVTDPSQSELGAPQETLVSPHASPTQRVGLEAGVVWVSILTENGDTLEAGPYSEVKEEELAVRAR